MKTILAAIDFSPITSAVVDEAVSLARAYDGRVVLMSVVLPSSAPTDPTVLAFLTDLKEIQAAMKKQALKDLGVIQARIKKEGLAAEMESIVGNPAMCLLAQAEKRKADYIVMGSHGHTAFYDLLVGSTAQLVLRRSRCPVMIVPPAGTQRQD